MSIKQIQHSPGYLAFVLDEASRSKLLEVCPPSFSKVVCHHVTISFGVSKKTLEEFQKDFSDSEPTVKATSLLIGENIECVTVLVDEKSDRKYSKDGGKYHVTLSLNPPEKPVDSNKLFTDSSVKKITFYKPISLTGEFTIVTS